MGTENLYNQEIEALFAKPFLRKALIYCALGDKDSTILTEREERLPMKVI